MIHYVYVLKSLKDGRLYKGLSTDVNARLSQHNAGKVKATKGFRPWVLVHTEQFETLFAAR
jgi:putative endonuclease